MWLILRLLFVRLELIPCNVLQHRALLWRGKGTRKNSAALTRLNESFSDKTAALTVDTVSSLPQPGISAWWRVAPPRYKSPMRFAKAAFVPRCVPR